MSNLKMSNTNGIKVSVQDEDRSKEKASTLVKKKASPRPAKPISNKARLASTKPKPKTNINKKSGLVKFLLAMIIPAAIIGAGIYLWQKGLAEKSVSSVRQEARKTEMSFEERLRNLKDKLTGMEDENKKLKEQTEEMNKRISLLNKAKIDFSDNELEIAFTYPAVFGEVIITKTDIASGTKFIGTFSDNEKLVFGGVSRDFIIKKDEEGSAVAVTDSHGFEENKGDYFFLAPGGEKYEIKPVEILESAVGKEALLIDKNSFVIDPEADGLPVDIGDNAAVIINLVNEEYNGLAFVNSDFGIMPLESFKQMINTIKN